MFCSELYWHFTRHLTRCLKNVKSPWMVPLSRSQEENIEKCIIVGAIHIWGRSFFFSRFSFSSPSYHSFIPLPLSLYSSPFIYFASKISSNWSTSTTKPSIALLQNMIAIFYLLLQPLLTVIKNHPWHQRKNTNTNLIKASQQSVTP